MLIIGIQMEDQMISCAIKSFMRHSQECVYSWYAFLCFNGLEFLTYERHFIIRLGITLYYEARTFYGMHYTIRLSIIGLGLHYIIRLVQ